MDYTFNETHLESIFVDEHLIEKLV